MTRHSEYTCRKAIGISGGLAVNDTAVSTPGFWVCLAKFLARPTGLARLGRKSRGACGARTPVGGKGVSAGLADRGSVEVHALHRAGPVRCVAVGAVVPVPGDAMKLADKARGLVGLRME